MQMSYQTYLDERALHIFMKKMDIKIAKSIHADLIKNNVIDKDHKFGVELDRSTIDGFHSHGRSSHNYREEIESYNQIIKRNSDYI